MRHLAIGDDRRGGNQQGGHDDRREQSLFHTRFLNLARQPPLGSGKSASAGWR